MKQFLLKILSFALVMATVAFIAPGNSAADPSIWAPPQLAILIEEGLEKNQDIQSLASTVKSFKEEVSFAGSLNDPRIGIGLLNLPTDTFEFDQEAMTQK